MTEVYSDLLNSGIKLSKPSFLFNKPKKVLECEYEEIILADPAFTLEERILILEAQQDLEFFCNGLVKLDIRFELDINDKDVIRENCVLFRVASTHPNIVASDERIKATTLGLCDYMNNNTRRLYLVSERLTNLTTFRTTVIHELGHFIGLDHTKSPSIMHRSNYSNVLYPTRIDAEEVAKVWSIKPQDLRYFKL